MADSDTHQQVFAPPPAAKLSENDRNTPLLPLYSTPYTEATPPPPYMPPSTGFQQLPAPYKQQIPGPVQMRPRQNRRGAYYCIAVGAIVLLIIPAIIFGVVVTRVNNDAGFSQRHGCISSTKDTFSTCDD
ncbi:hypothetical protein HYFRA_00008230 [Hymenoscyphus fraxineus]|uniref:Uncharacterized protein n=1 Tax=Hymenoscyphus fraxineus TaxID=746836 RepID=A0A9N9LA70_9HELO|nr:hypothetical protein HYFRA_00008230 [Hymenoscyphus fraxineus]